MKNKNKLMETLMVAGFGFGYFVLSYAPSSIQLTFFGFILLATIVYLVESIKRKYGKIHIIMTILGFLIGINLIFINLMNNKYPSLMKDENYILIFSTCIIIMMLILGGINYYKTGSENQKK